MNIQGSDFLVVFRKRFTGYAIQTTFDSDFTIGLRFGPVYGLAASVPDEVGFGESRFHELFCQLQGFSGRPARPQRMVAVGQKQA